MLSSKKSLRNTGLLPKSDQKAGKFLGSLRSPLEIQTFSWNIRPKSDQKWANGLIKDHGLINQTIVGTLHIRHCSTPAAC
jgi:hypothetical protein